MIPSMPNPYDVEFGYNEYLDKEWEYNLQVDQQVEDRKLEFLRLVDDLFMRYGVDEFHAGNDFDFDFALLMLEKMARNKITEATYNV